MNHFNLALTLCVLAVMILACSGEPQTKRTPSGYDYVYYTDKTGPTPKVGEYVYYHLDILDDKDSLIQSSRQHPNQPIASIPEEETNQQGPNPLLDIIKQASTGDSIGLFLPKDSIPNLPPQFSDINHIEYKLVVTEIVDKDTYDTRMEAERAIAQKKAEELQARESEVEELVLSHIDQYKKDELADKLTTVEGDLKYYLVEEGSGPQATNGSVVQAQYYGCTLDGKMFDNSFGRGRGIPVSVGSGGVIQGWDKTFPNLREGDKVTLFIPAALAYGEMGSPPNIGPNEDLVFYIEVESVN